jgi:Protein of unknown function (DUF3429)
MTPNTIPRWPAVLGFAGLLPPVAAVLVAGFAGPRFHYTALAIGYAYAALIFSFLGGLWWGLAAAASARGDQVPSWLWFVSVIPSLVALICFMPWFHGDPWPGPSLFLLGAGIAASPLVDRQISRGPACLTPPWWMRLRWALSLGLGSATLALGIVAGG